MLATKSRSLVPVVKRSFAVTISELHAMNAQVRRKINMIKMLTKDKDFTYEPPRMIYDKASGDVTILPKEYKKKNTLIQGYDDVARERKALFEEMGIPDGDPSKLDIKGDPEGAAEKVYQAAVKEDENFDYDLTKFFAFSRDRFRVDIGLIIMRPPIFLHMRDLDIEMMKLRSEVMNEYYCDMRKYVKEFKEVTQLNESLLAHNPYTSESNMDNYPTHEYTDPATGETMAYCGASKNFAKVDPNCTDWRSIHYAPEDRTYFLVRNRFTEEWQFPVGQMLFGTTFVRAKHNMFVDLCNKAWNIKFQGNLP